MVRTGRTESEERSETGTLEEEGPVSTVETKMLENLTLGDLDTEPSTDEENKEEPTDSKDKFDFEEWAEHQHIQRRNEEVLREDRMLSMHGAHPRTQGYRGRHRPMGKRTKEQTRMRTETQTALEKNKTSRVPGRQPDGKPEHQRIQVGASVSEGEGNDNPGSLNTVRKSTQENQLSAVEGSRGKIEARLALVDFGSLSKINRPGWREFCRGNDPEVTKKETEVCTCYSFDQECWANSEERWVPHIQHCGKCRRWNDQRCVLTGHISFTPTTEVHAYRGRPSIRRHILQPPGYCQAPGHAAEEGVPLSGGRPHHQSSGKIPALWIKGPNPFQQIILPMATVVSCTH